MPVLCNLAEHHPPSIMKFNNHKKVIYIILSLIFCLVTKTLAQENDSLAIHWLGHGTLYFEFNETIIHVDPYSNQADYNTLPDADLIFITHDHGDHYDLNAINQIKKDSTLLICPQIIMDIGTYPDTAIVLNNWDSAVFNDIPIKAVPAYNYEPGQIYHAEGIGNGYVFTFNDLKVYVAGDTEDIDDMARLGEIHIAFLPMNLPYTMTPEQAANAAEMIKPNILYVYHFGSSDTAYFRTLVEDKIADVRIGESLRYDKTTDLNFPTKIKKNFTNSEIRIFPNPASDFMSVSNYSAGSELHIYDTVGNLMLSKLLENSGESRIELSSLLDGCYIVKISNEEFHVQFPFVKL